MITIPIEFQSLKSRVDHSWTITMSTGELSPQQVQELASLIHELCYVAIKKDPLRKEEEQMISNLESEIDFGGKQKTQCQRLRGAIYRWWEHDHQGYEDSELHYRYIMEKFIDHVKSKLG